MHRKLDEMVGRSDLLKVKDIDAVFISTPDFLHEEMAVAALKAAQTQPSPTDWITTGDTNSNKHKEG